MHITVMKLWFKDWRIIHPKIPIHHSSVGVSLYYTLEIRWCEGAVFFITAELYTTTQVFLTKWWDKGKCWSNWYSHNKQLLTSNETDRKYNSYTGPRELILTHTPLWLNKGLVYVCQFRWSFRGNIGESVINDDWQNNILMSHIWYNTVIANFVWQTGRNGMSTKEQSLYTVIYVCMGLCELRPVKTIACTLIINDTCLCYLALAAGHGLHRSTQHTWVDQLTTELLPR